MRLFLSFCVIACLLALAAHAGSKPGADAAVTAKAVFAGGHFWGLQPAFNETPGVLSTVVGFTGGPVIKEEDKLSFPDVASGKTGHVMAVEVTYDPAKITYERLLHVFWRNIDPVDGDGQFCDRGRAFRSVIFYSDDVQRQKAEDSRMLLEADSERFNDKPITTEILPSGAFYPAEDYHQSYYKKNPFRFNFYKGRCGRDVRLNALWGKAAPKH